MAKDEQKIMVHHINDIQNKQSSNRFIADQLKVGHDAFVRMLKESLESEKVKDEEWRLKEFH